MSTEARPDPRRIEEIFDIVVDLEPAIAACRLDEECAGDDALRAAVEALLRHDRAATGDFLKPDIAALAEAVRDARELASNPEGSDAEAARAPARLGRFFVLRKLGEGGMGVVYVGYDEMLDRRVALKLLRRGSSASEWLLREAQALARLSHPNVVAVHEVGEHEGRIFLAMELVDGQSLREWLRQGERPVQELIPLFLQAGRGLAAAHEAGLVHRDFKPENVLCGKDGRVRVVDFGIAALSDPEAEPAPVSIPPQSGRSLHRSPSALESPLTQTGALVGTPAYMAPEQLRGERATPASDQFAFCVSLYRAAYGTAPFPGEGVEELMQSVLDGALRPPPEQKDVPAWLPAILRRGLSADPAGRFPSMKALLAAIEASLPRSPELDSFAVRRERRQLVVTLGTFSVGIATFVTARGAAHTLEDPRFPVLIAVAILTATSVTITLLRRRLLKNQYGRRIAALLLSPCLAWLFHRLVALRLGTPPLHVIVVDLILYGVIFSTASITFERWMALPAAFAFTAAGASAVMPVLGPPLIFVVSLSGVLCALAKWRVEG